MKKCRICNTCKPLDDFYNRKSSKDGKRSECKSCFAEKDKQKAIKNKYKIKETKKLYYENNKKYISNKKKEYYLKNKEALKTKLKKYYQDNKEEISKKRFLI